MIAVLLMTTTLAGCLGGTEEFDTSDLEQQIEDLQQSQDEMNQTMEQQAQTNADLLASIASIQGDIGTSQSAITSIITELEQGNSTDDDLLAQLLVAQESLLSLEGELINSTSDLSDRLNVSDSSVNWAYLDLSGADLSWADLTGANLSNTDLTSATLWYTDLSNADLEDADLRYADLSSADLSNADLTGVNWGDTICPDGTNSDNNGDTCENNL